ncbi:MAG: hypothetical protein E7640_03395 [Ruminococcaceae bacterium]|nr:hypothetical protein [Oscillospiraceae bacterium]
MEQTKETGTLTFADILRMFSGKFIKLICVVLAFAIVFAGFVFIKSLLSPNYGSKITFYVSHTDASYQLLTILNSEAFAEKLLLDENGLPPKDQCDAAEYEAALAAIKAYNEARKIKYEANKKLQLFPFEFAAIEQEYKALRDEYDRTYNLLDTYQSVWSDKIAENPEHSVMIASLEAELEIIKNKITKFEQGDENNMGYLEALRTKLAIESDYAVASENVKSARKIAEELSEKVVSDWRAEAAETIMEYSVSISASFAAYENIFNTENKNANEGSEEIKKGLFLTFDVSSPKKESAAEIIEKIKSVAPSVIEENLEKLTGEVEIDCNLISTVSDAAKVSESDLKTVGIFGIIGALVGFVIFCAIVILRGFWITAVAAPKEAEAPVEEIENIYAEK